MSGRKRAACWTGKIGAVSAETCEQVSGTERTSRVTYGASWRLLWKARPATEAQALLELFVLTRWAFLGVAFLSTPEHSPGRAYSDRFMKIVVPKMQKYLRTFWYNKDVGNGANVPVVDCLRYPAGSIPQLRMYDGLIGGDGLWKDCRPSGNYSLRGHSAFIDTNQGFSGLVSVAQDDSPEPSRASVRIVPALFRSAGQLLLTSRGTL